MNLYLEDLARFASGMVGLQKSAAARLQCNFHLEKEAAHRYFPELTSFLEKEAGGFGTAGRTILDGLKQGWGSAKGMWNTAAERVGGFVNSNSRAVRKTIQKAQDAAAARGKPLSARTVAKHEKMLAEANKPNRMYGNMILGGGLLGLGGAAIPGSSETGEIDA